MHLKNVHLWDSLDYNLSYDIAMVLLWGLEKNHLILFIYTVRHETEPANTTYYSPTFCCVLVSREV